MGLLITECDPRRNTRWPSLLCNVSCDTLSQCEALKYLLEKFCEVRKFRSIEERCLLKNCYIRWALRSPSRKSCLLKTKERNALHPDLIFKSMAHRTRNLRHHASHQIGGNYASFIVQTMRCLTLQFFTWNAYRGDRVRYLMNSREQSSEFQFRFQPTLVWKSPTVLQERLNN